MYNYVLPMWTQAWCQKVRDISSESWNILIENIEKLLNNFNTKIYDCTAAYYLKTYTYVKCMRPVY